MRILFLCTEFRINGSSHAKRAEVIYKACLAAGCEVDVITNWGASIKEKEEINYFSTAELFYPKIIKKINKYRLNKYSNYIKSIFSRFFSLFSAPDHLFDFYFNAKKIYSSKLKERQYNLIVSSSGSLSAHLLAKTISSQLSIDYVMDLGDPWADNPLPPLCWPHIKLINRYLERHCIKKATAILVTTESYKKQLENYYSDNKFKINTNKIHFIPCGYDNFLMFDSKNIKNNIDAITISYIGTAGSSRDFSEAFKNLIKNKNHYTDVKLILAGNISEKIKTSLFSTVNNFESYDWLSEYESNKLIKKSDVLIVAGNKSENQIPGKLYANMASQSIILYIGRRELYIDPVRSLIKDIPGVYNCFYDSNASDFDLFWSNLSKIRSDAFDRVLDQNIGRYKWNEIQFAITSVLKRGLS